MTKNWEKEKERMHELYMMRNLKLATVIEIMSNQHQFQASERAYKQKFKEWQWFKKTQRSPAPAPVKQEQHSPIDDNSDHTPPRNGDLSQPYRMHQHRISGRGVSMDGSDYGHNFHIPFDPNQYPPVTTAEMDVYGHAAHHGHPMAPPAQHHGMTLGPYGRGGVSGQVSLPSVQTLHRHSIHRQHFHEHIREAERRVEMHQYEHAEDALQNALRSLQWLRESN
ncbi:hypothetical protein FPQ18DRAFT_122011 [Pyronema domesticum]|uniref:Clr5 domain-containing protein n=1 Tax=Pyronema omphalodes (strain CBS 100304) TaxID=1076935 RepID=U4LMA1_PYROM|nr:hypothetical protein FPQ18DRAFT_122011 [Pyronema domesticum]CCX32717.1 Similar to hypothetical protein [Tuber melanosporum Mel28]; acc. no. XP_002840168 [Pyronema omphalodes CBS 100304]